MIESFLLLAVACLAMWLSTSLAIKAVEKISPLFRVSKFTVSLLVLGVVTSFPEITVSLNAFAVNAPQIAVGSLIGSQIFLLFVMIPVLAIVTNGLNLQLEMKNVSLSVAILLALLPMLALFDQRLDLIEALVIILLYVIFAVVFTQKSNMIEKIMQRFQQPSQATVSWEVVKLLLGVGILLVASNTAVREIVEIAAVLQTPRFLLSMVLLPIITNMPELSLALGSLNGMRKDLVLGDYLGAITFNSLLLAVLTFAMNGNIEIGQNISLLIILFALAILAFWLACSSKNALSSKEGLLFLMFYVVLLVAAGWQIMSAFS